MARHSMGAPVAGMGRRKAARSSTGRIDRSSVIAARNADIEGPLAHEHAEATVDPAGGVGELRLGRHEHADAVLTNADDAGAQQLEHR